MDNQNNTLAADSAVAISSQQDEQRVTYNGNTATVTLDEPLVMGEQQIKAITLRLPKGGELRDVNMNDLANMNVGAILKVLPRIATPIVTSQLAASLSAADTFQIGLIIAGFLAPKKQRAEMTATLQAAS